MDYGLKILAVAVLMLSCLFVPVRSSASVTETLEKFSEQTGCPLPVAGNRVEIMADAGHFYDELLTEIRGAEDFILMEFFIFREDSISTVILDAMAEKASEGVRTCLILDHYGCAQHLEEKGRRFRTIPFRAGYLQHYRDSGVDIVLFNKESAFPRNHRKLVLIDGKVAFTGGMNVTDLYLDGIAGVGKFWDMHLRIEGPAVAHFNDGFMRMWLECGKRPPAISFPGSPAPCGDVPLIVLETQGRSSKPNPEELYTRLFSMAKDTIRFISGYFRPGKAIREALMAAAARGVQVQILMGASTDMPALIDKVLMHSATSLAKEENFTFHIDNGGFHHEKVVSIDGHLIVIGSHNLDWFSMKANHELSVLMDSPSIAREFDAYFDSCIESGGS